MRLLRLPAAALRCCLPARGLHQKSSPNLADPNPTASIYPPYPDSTLPSLSAIERLAESRKNHANLPLIRTTLHQLQQDSSAPQRSALLQLLHRELRLLPNETHPAVRDLPDDAPRILGHHGGEHRQLLRDGSKPREFSDLCRKLNILRTEHLGHFCGPKSYYLLGALADLEQALISFTTRALRERGFRLIAVPDILPAAVIEGCGMQVSGARNQVYKVDTAGGAQCLSGTAEMALGGYFAGRRLKADTLPERLMAASRCFRAETSGLQEEKGIYRVHSFTKVEMFAVCSGPQQSGEMLEEFRALEEGLFTRLGLPFRVLDMPPAELGAPAYRKYDVEAWMPGRGIYGEISSCSDCRDWQARRLDIRVEGGGEGDEEEGWAHTVNGTACAVPRMLIAIVENYQNPDGSVDIPLELQPYLHGRTQIVRTKELPELKLIKSMKENWF